MRKFYDCTQKEQIARWENVVRVLRSLTRHQRREHWNMGLIGRRTPCGTVACAAGHCSLDPWFRRRGYIGKFDDAEDANDAELLTPDEWKFFGDYGAQSIFFNIAPRPVGRVIRECLAYIKTLRHLR